MNRPAPAAGTPVDARFRLAAMDLDGTLLNRERRIGPRDLAALERLRAQGVAVAVISGRRFAELEDLTAELPPVVFRAGHGGALIRQAGRTLLEVPLDRDAARAALQLTEGMDLITLISDRSGQVRIRAADTRSERVRRYLDSVRPPPRLERSPAFSEDPLHVAFAGSPAECRRAEDELRESLADAVSVARTEYRRLNLGLLDVLSPRAGKAAALRTIAAAAGVAPEATVAIGDNWNDLEMLRAAGVGVMMGNAAPELRALGFETTVGNDAGGVAAAVDRLIPPGLPSR